MQFQFSVCTVHVVELTIKLTLTFDFDFIFCYVDRYFVILFCLLHFLFQRDFSLGFIGF